MRHFRHIVALLLLTASYLAMADTSAATRMPTVTMEDMAKAQSESAMMLKSPQMANELQKAQQLAKDTMFKFDPKYTGLDSPGLIQNMPRISPDALKRKDVNDYDRLTKQFYAGIESKLSQDDLVVFVSLSMPKESLRALVEQSHRYGAVMVLRGLKDNSLKATMLEIRSILGDETRKANIQINPVAFSKLDIKHVPTFAVIRGSEISNGDSQACAPASAYMTVAGDVPMEYALEKLAQVAPPDFASIAQSHLNQGRGR